MDHHRQHFYISGEWVEPLDATGTVDVVDPATEQVVGSVPDAGVADVRRAIAAARLAFDKGPWPRMRPLERARAMLRMAEVIERRREELIAINIAEAGSVRSMAGPVQVDAPLAQFVDMAERVLPGFAFEQGMLPNVGHVLGQGVVLREPLGVAALITPYNFPFFLNLMKLAPALAAGCTTVLKPSPLTPLEAFVLGEIADEADLPPGVLNVVTGDCAAAKELTSHVDVDAVSFTGSTAVGTIVALQAAPTMKRVVLELGGKSASIVCADADLDRVAADVVSAMTMHCGQACTALTRTLVDRQVHDDLATRVVARLAGVEVGDPNRAGVAMGPLISARQREAVEGHIAEGIEQGAQVAFGGGRPHGLDRGWYVEPTLFVDVANTMTIARREIFGPVGTLIAYDGIDEAVRIANDNDYGLGGAVWSNNPTRAYAIARRLRTGSVNINGGGGLNATAPFGGYKMSGVGRERGHAGISEFLETKSVTWQVARG
jgi:aldehyde dehydrogenase (NAD+)